MPVTYCTAVTALFLFSCSYFPPWFFCISLFNWLEENKAEKWDSKVNIWNAVPLKKKIVVFYEVDKGFMSRYVKCDGYTHYWLKEQFCLGSKSSHSFMDWPMRCARHGHSSSFAQCHGTFVLVTNSELSFSCLCPASHVYEGSAVGTPVSDRFRLLGHTSVQFHHLSKETSFLRHRRKTHPDIKSITCFISLWYSETISNRVATS